MNLEMFGVRDFTCYEDCSVEFDTTINLILGANASGKTSILDGIAYLLTGRCARTDRAGKGADHMVRVGNKEATLTARMDGMEVTRTIPGGLSIDGQYGTSTSLQEYLDDFMGADNKVVTAALNTTEFIGMKPSDQKNMLFDLMGLAFGRDDIIKRVIAEIEDDVNVLRGKVIHKMLATAPGNLFDGTGKTWGNLWNHFKVGRRDTKRLLKEKGAKQKVVSVPGLPLKADVEKRIQDMLGEVDVKLEQRAVHDRDSKHRERLNQDLATYRGKLKTAGDPKNAKVELAKLDEKLNGYNREISEKKGKAEGFAEEAKTIGSTNECPLGSITCPLTDNERGEIVAGLESKYDELVINIKQIEEARSPLQQKRKELVAETEKHSRYEIEAAIEKIEGEWAEIADSAVNPQELTGEIEALRNKIDEDQGILKDINQNDWKKEEAARQDAERKVLAEQVEVLELLVEVLGPKGLPGKILAETIGPVQEQVNARLQELTDGRYSITLEIEPNFKILVSHDGVTSDLKRLSSSERLRVGIIIQDVLVKLTGLRFLIVDNVDMLDAVNQGMLVDTLCKIKDDYDTIIVLATDRREYVSDAQIEDMTIWWLEDGKITAVNNE